MTGDSSFSIFQIFPSQHEAKVLPNFCWVTCGGSGVLARRTYLAIYPHSHSSSFFFPPPPNPHHFLFRLTSTSTLLPLLFQGWERAALPES